VTGEQLLEREIRDTEALLWSARTPEGRQSAFAHLRSLCRQATAQRVFQEFGASVPGLQGNPAGAAPLRQPR
jgi:hypothetical protein